MESYEKVLIVAKCNVNKYTYWTTGEIEEY